MHDDDDNAIQCHQEGGHKRKVMDDLDRNLIISEVKKYTNPLSCKPEDPRVNIVSGRVAPDSVNVDNALSIGQQMSSEFFTILPHGFHAPLKR